LDSRHQVQSQKIQKELNIHPSRILNIPTGQNFINQALLQLDRLFALKEVSDSERGGCGPSNLCAEVVKNLGVRFAAIRS